MAWHGMAWHGMAWRGIGMAWHGMAWHGDCGLVELDSSKSRLELDGGRGETDRHGIRWCGQIGRWILLVDDTSYETGLRTSTTVQAECRYGISSRIE